MNKFFTGWRPNVRLSRVLLRQVHKAFGGELRAHVYRRRLHGTVRRCSSSTISEFPWPTDMV